ncbi:unnamed protein product [Cylindrotheca closterium]|uniref:MaoC-like domain-containing protein n=1 Tax=Cylindrotheca closterium TaxID=2856 RepID=A0AAD2JIW8_9STRA|nr:unnamed protein product [Cylindrotheca closterium]
MADTRSTQYEVEYNAKDLILYALSVGFGCSSTTDELEYLYEQHENFNPLPTFCLALTFWARSRDGNTMGIPSFPPPLMQKDDVIPRRFLRQQDLDLSNQPVIHTFQSIIWHRPMPIPSLEFVSGRCNGKVRTTISLETVAVQPKSIGTFVTTQSQIFAAEPAVEGRSNNNSCPLVCTMQSTALVFGVDSESIIPYKSSSGTPKKQSKINVPKDRPPTLEWTFQTQPNQALLYRLSSGDSNHIHVDNSAAEMLGTGKNVPLLHGLLTLAIAFRAVSKLASKNDRIHILEGKFTKPAFVGDELLIKVWREDSSSVSRFIFIVLNKETGVTLIDRGLAEFGSTSNSPMSKM